MGCLSQSLSVPAGEDLGPKSDLALQIKNLSVVFAKRGRVLGSQISELRAIDNLSLDLYRSEVMSVVGESGIWEDHPSKMRNETAGTYFGLYHLQRFGFNKNFRTESTPRLS